MNKEETLIAFSKQWDVAMEGNDADAIGEYMADDWVCVGDSGMNDKATFLQWIRSGDLQHTTMHVEDMRIKIYGDTGIITNKGTSAGSYKGEPFNLYEWQTSVFRIENGQWTCVLTMLVPAKKE